MSRFPALDEVCYAATGEGSWFQARELAPKRNRVKDVSRLEDAVFCTTTMRRWDRLGKKEVFDHLCKTCKLTRGWGDCYGHCLVASGRIQLMIDTGMSVWDAAALVPMTMSCSVARLLITSSSGVSLKETSVVDCSAAS